MPLIGRPFASQIHANLDSKLPHMCSQQSAAGSDSTLHNSCGEPVNASGKKGSSSTPNAFEVWLGRLYHQQFWELNASKDQPIHQHAGRRCRRCGRRLHLQQPMVETDTQASSESHGIGSAEVHQNIANKRNCKPPPHPN